MKQICDGYNPNVLMGNFYSLLKAIGMNNHSLYHNPLEINQLNSVDQNKLISDLLTLKADLNN